MIYLHKLGDLCCSKGCIVYLQVHKTTVLPCWCHKDANETSWSNRKVVIAQLERRTRSRTIAGSRLRELQGYRVATGSLIHKKMSI